MFSVAFVVCSVGSSLCNELITRSEESYRVCVYLWVIYKTSTLRRLHPTWTVAPQTGDDDDDDDDDDGNDNNVLCFLFVFIWNLMIAILGRNM